MKPINLPPGEASQLLSYILGAVVWLVSWAAIFAFDGYLDINNLAMLLVIASVLVSVCWPWRLSVCFSIGFLLAFDWCFIPPRGTFTVDFHQHTVMLLVLLVVNLVVLGLMAVQRAHSRRARRYAVEADILRQWSDILLESMEPQVYFSELQNLLQQLSGCDVALLILKNELPPQDDLQFTWLLGDAGIEQRHALWYCTRHNQQLGRGTGRYETFSDVYLPLRARGHALGAVLLHNFAEHEFSTRVHLQAICDQFGNALERYRLHQQEIKARENIQAQLVRNNLLAAISHDYRTPLATIMGAASSLNEQAEKLDAQQQHQLVRRIYDEAERLNIMTSNILQLARLDADKKIHGDWQSVEEIIGDLLRRWRERNRGQRLHIQLQPDLPLLWCDAMLIGQLLENLVDNALKYSPENTPITVHASMRDDEFILAVIDQGRGVDLRWRDKIFEPFQRAPANTNGAMTNGAGVGLALCRTIALAHGGDLRVECPAAGGSRFSLHLPRRELPTEAPTPSRERP